MFCLFVCLFVVKQGTEVISEEKQTDLRRIFSGVVGVSTLLTQNNNFKQNFLSVLDSVLAHQENVEDDMKMGCGNGNESNEEAATKTRG